MADVIKSHRGQFLLTQLGVLHYPIPLAQLIDESNEESGFGYKEPGPMGFLVFTNGYPNPPNPPTPRKDTLDTSRKKKKDAKDQKLKERELHRQAGPIQVANIMDLPDDCRDLLQGAQLTEEDFNTHTRIILNASICRHNILQLRTGYTFMFRRASRMTESPSTDFQPKEENIHSNPDKFKVAVEVVTLDQAKKMYRDFKPVGKGGFGTVLCARVAKDKTQVAVKKVPHTTDKEKASNMDEIGFLNFCSHPNIVKFLKAYEVQDDMWIVMEYMQGGTLTEAAEQYPFTEANIAYVALEILKGLKYLHENKLVHRDLKSANIMLTVEGQVKLVDFGLCVEMNDEKPLICMAGSPFWMAPEMIKGLPHSYPCDYYSFGVCLLELASRAPPNRGNPIRAMFNTATVGNPGLDNPEKWTAEFKQFITRCLEMDPAKRGTGPELLAHPFVATADNQDTMKKILFNIFITNTIKELYF